MKNKYQEALNEMYAVLNDSKRWHEKKALLQELVDKETPKETVFDLENYMFYGLCPNCKSRKVADYEYDNIYNHCSDCGQKLSWDNHEGVNNKAIDWSEE